MRRLKMVALALSTVLALGAITAVAAQAEPEFTPKGGTFPVGFGGAIADQTIFEIEGQGKLECFTTGTSTEIKGSLAESRLAKGILITFKGCKILFVGGSGGSCRTAGKIGGEVVTEELQAKPVYIEGKTKPNEERGWDFSPVEHKFMEFECTLPSGTEVLRVENGTPANNSVIARVIASWVGVYVNKFFIVFRESNSIQEPTTYEEPAGKSHEDFLETEGSGPIKFSKNKSGLLVEEEIAWAKGEEVELS